MFANKLPDIQEVLKEQLDKQLEKKPIELQQTQEPKENDVIVINGTEPPSGQISRSNSETKLDTKQDTIVKKPRRFMNGWTKEQEKLMADWSDICTVYKWCHEKAEQRFHISGLTMNLSIIVISSLAGFSNIGVQSLFEGNVQALKYASFAIGGVSLLASILTTIANTLKWNALSESHRVAGIGWGKFGRQVSVELALHPNDRIDSLDFLKICRAELDRLIEQSPQIPIFIIKEFEKKFGDITDLKRPEICGKLEHTKVYESSQERLKNLAVEASLMLRKKKEMLKELITPEMESRIAIQVNQRLEAAIEERRNRLEEEIEMKHREEEDKRRLADKLIQDRKEEIRQEIELAKKKLEEELEAEKVKAAEKEKIINRLAEQRKKEVEKEMDLERQRQQVIATITGIHEGATAPKLFGSSYENRLIMNRANTRSRSQSVRRKSHIADGMFTLETLHNNPQGTIRISDMGAQINMTRDIYKPLTNEIIQGQVIQEQLNKKEVKEFKNDIIIVSKE